MPGQATALELPTRCGRVAGALLPMSPPVRCWLGIPYAAPPVGRWRWCPPQPVQPWSGVRPATRFGADSVQAPMPASRAGTVSEDCLFLNVWSPAAAPPGALPVMVWLHGGGFVGGSGAETRCDGTALAQQGVVVVSLNYRTGLFGFLAHPGLSAESPQRSSGNYGLLDQLAALAWVRDSIGAFGGDPSRVTVFGVSAGSASISLLLTSPAAEGLFHQAILHSPGAGRPLAGLDDAERAGLALGGRIDALRALTATELFALTPRLSPLVRGLTSPRVLRPIRDGWLIARDERDAFASGGLRRMQLIVGTNSDEGTLLTRGWPVRTVAELRALIAANFPHDTGRALALYGAADEAQVPARLAEAFADTQFNFGARLLLRAMVRQQPRCWRYLFSRRRPGQADGPHHGDEVGHVFGNLGAGRGAPSLPFDAVDQALSRAMSGAWVAFARRADPNGEGLPAWPAFAPDGERHLDFGDPIAVGSDARRPMLDFLDACGAAG